MPSGCSGERATVIVVIDVVAYAAWAVVVFLLSPSRLVGVACPGASFGEKLRFAILILLFPHKPVLRKSVLLASG